MKGLTCRINGVETEVEVTISEEDEKLVEIRFGYGSLCHMTPGEADLFETAVHRANRRARSRG